MAHINIASIMRLHICGLLHIVWLAKAFLYEAHVLWYMYSATTNHVAIPSKSAC